MGFRIQSILQHLVTSFQEPLLKKTYTQSCNSYRSPLLKLPCTIRYVLGEFWFKSLIRSDLPGQGGFLGGCGDFSPMGVLGQCVHPGGRFRFRVSGLGFRVWGLGCGVLKLSPSAFLWILYTDKRYLHIYMYAPVVYKHITY